MVAAVAVVDRLTNQNPVSTATVQSPSSAPVTTSQTNNASPAPSELPAADVSTMAVDDVATALTPTSMSGDGLAVDLSLDSGFQVVDVADQGSSDSGSSDVATSSSASTQVQEPPSDESSLSTSEVDDSSQSEPTADTETSSDSEDPSQADASDTEASVDSAEMSTQQTSPAKRVTIVDAKTAGESVVTSDEEATQKLSQNLNLSDLSDRKTPTVAEIANYLQQTMQKIRSGTPR